MLKDADHSYFAGVYIVCGYTDLRFGIDSVYDTLKLPEKSVKNP